MARHTLNQDRAEALARIALGHVEREFPNYLMHTLDGPGDARSPRDLHPVFFGSYDWHSCVHGHWMLARLMSRHPSFAPAAEIRALFDRRFEPDAIAGECAYFARPSARGFERPYGWAWLLKLAAELASLDPRWSARLAPLTDVVVDCFLDFLPRAAYPVRTGTHYNQAFALALAADYARASGRGDLLALLERTAVAWFAADRDCQAWEPDGDAFLSPALMEAECMRRLLPAERWRPWFDGFLPGIHQRRPETLFQPARVSDPSDGKIAHLDGLNLSRAWCWRSLASGLPDGDPRRPVMVAAAEDHLDASLGQVSGHYMGEHWLASFAVLALEA